MRRLFFWLGTWCAAALLPCSAEAQSRQNPRPDTSSAGWSVRRGDAQRGGHRHGQRGHRHHHHHHGHHHHHRDTVWLLWPPMFPWFGNFGYGPPFGGPVFGPAASLPYVAGGWGASLPEAPPSDPSAVQPAPSDPVAAKPKVRITNPEAKARAGRFISTGDANFSKQSYLSAVERYKSAARTAPDLAETYLRQAFAFVAMGNYDSAAREFRRALALQPDWSRSPVRLDQLYGNDHPTKTAHLEKLAEAVEANPRDAALLMLLGMQLFFDGQAERSEVFFQHADALGANANNMLDAFLPKPRPAGAAPADKAPADKLVF